MPFKSEQQRKYLWSQKPEVAEEFAEHTTKEESKDLPKYASKDKNHLKDYTKKHRRKQNG
jgi:hypothetical protein